MFQGRLAIKEGVLTTYRAALYERVAAACAGGLFVATGLPRHATGMATREHLVRASHRMLMNRYFLNEPLMTFWQSGSAAWLDEISPDAVIFDANPRCLDTRWLIPRLRRRKVPVLGWGLGTLSLSRGVERLRSLVRNGFLRQLDGVIAYSTRAAREYIAVGLPAERVFVAHNAAVARPREPLAKRGGFCTPAEAKVLFVGRLIEWKRVDLLLHACASLDARRQPELIIVGEGPMRAAYERLAAEVYPRTRFLGAIHGAELAQILSSADLFVLPNRGGLAIQEAMAHGLPVIASDADGTELDLVRPGNGWLVPPLDAPALAAAIEGALADPARLREMGKESHRIVDQEINLETMAASIVCAVEAVKAGYN